MVPRMTHVLDGGALYATYDRFPAPKGASTHIARFAGALLGAADHGLLHCLAGDTLPPYQQEGTITIRRTAATEVHPLGRAERFGAEVADSVARERWTTAQGREPWSVMALLAEDRTWPVVYEVNGLPSIEWAETYPQAPRADLAAIDALERWCLDRVDAVVTPSAVTAQALADRGVSSERIAVIPNGADLPDPTLPRPLDSPPGPYLVYVGGLQPWQGVDVAVRALGRIRDLGIPLVVVTGARPRQLRPLLQLARRLDVGDLVHVRTAQDAAATSSWLVHASASLAPLRDTRRNTVQGCCPLKVVESLAAGTPVIGSDLEVIRAEVPDGIHGLLVRPDRPRDLARAIRVALDAPEALARWGAAGRAHIASNRTWSAAEQALLDVHARLLTT